MADSVKLPIENTIDLHSFQPREIPCLVQEYLYQALLKRYREVCIIHGRGIGVQRNVVQSILKRHPHVISFRDTPDRGATLVVLSPEQAVKEKVK